MPRRFVSELATGARVDDVFAVTSKEMRSTRGGEAYLSLEFADRSGRIPGVYFRPGVDATAAPVGAVVRVRGSVTTFRGVKRISVESLTPVERYEPEDLIAECTRDRDELIDELRQLVASVANPGLRRLLARVFGDQSFFSRFVRCPASQSHHHSYAGGLLEHTVAVASLCASLSDRYPETDGDLLTTAALLHDIGKVDELEFKVTIEYTDVGRLLGHVVLGVQKVASAAGELSPHIERSLLARLEHALLSHHGELEWGSPKRPATLEAMLLHHADNLDAKAAGFVSAASRAVMVEESWTDADNLFRRPLYAPRSLEDDRVHTAHEDEQYCQRSA